MSLPWNKAVRVRVGAQSVQGTVHPAWSPGRILAQARRDIEGAAAEVEQPVSEATPFASALAGVLSDLGVGSDSRVRSGRVSMADARVHFDVVPGDYADLSERQLQSIARVCVSEILGERANGHEVRWQLQKDLRHLFIAAMGASDVAQVMDLATTSGIGAMSLQPDFCTRWNAHRQALSGRSGVFVSVDGGHMVAALVQQGAITALSSGLVRQPGSADDVGGRKPELDERVDRLLFGVGQDPDQLSSFLLAGSQPDALLSPRWQAVGVDGGAT